MCNLTWTPHSNLEKDNRRNHSCVSPSMGCFEYTYLRAKINKSQITDTVGTSFELFYGGGDLPALLRNVPGSCRNL